MPLAAVDNLERRVEFVDKSVEAKLETGSVIHLAGATELRVFGEGEVVCSLLLSGWNGIGDSIHHGTSWDANKYFMKRK